MFTLEDTANDLKRLDYGDGEIRSALEYIRGLHKKKGLPYVELVQSSFFGTIKYLIKELNDENGTVLITDLDTNNTYQVRDIGEEQKKKDNIQEWIQNTRK